MVPMGVKIVEVKLYAMLVKSTDLRTAAVKRSVATYGRSFPLLMLTGGFFSLAVAFLVLDPYGLEAACWDAVAQRIREALPPLRPLAPPLPLPWKPLPLHDDGSCVDVCL